MSEKSTTGSEILAVDDDGVCLVYLQSVLEELGYQCNLASDGQQALAMIKQDKPRVILLDLDMPKMRGEALIEYLRNDSNYGDIRIIVISADEDNEAVANSINLGADDHIIKPFNPVILNARLQSSLAKHRLHEMQVNEEQRLIQLVEERTREIQRINIQLQSLDHAKNQFLTALSHELLTPLNCMGVVDMLLLEDEFSKEERQEIYADYQNAFGQLKKVVDHALIISRLTIESKREEDDYFAPSDLISVLSEVTESGCSIDPPVIKGSLDTEGYFIGDYKLIFHAFQAIVDLAAKFSDDSSNVQVCGYLNKDSLVITAKSWGYVIPEECLDKIFEVLAISDALFPGGDLGLGPAMARQVLLTHNGDLVAENHDDNGVVFTATLPLIKVPATAKYLQLAAI